MNVGSRNLTVISQFIFIQNAAVALVNDICDPDASDFKPKFLASLEQFIPKWFVQLFRKRIGMCRDNRHVSILWIRVVQWRILLDSKVENIILMCRERPREATDVRSFDLVLV